MILFWSILACMIMMSLMFVVWPLLINSALPKYADETVQTKLLQKSIQDLKLEYQSGLLDDAAYAVARNELAEVFLIDAKINGSLISENFSSTQLKWITVIALIVVIPLFSITCYLKLGAAKQLADWYASQKNQEKIQTLIAEIKS